jgi:hypothetical protein
MREYNTINSRSNDCDLIDYDVSIKSDEDGNSVLIINHTYKQHTPINSITLDFKLSLED